MTARAKILAALHEAPWPLPIHRIPVEGVSQTSMSARLRELAREGIVVSYPVPGSRCTAWALTPADLTLPLSI